MANIFPGGVSYFTLSKANLHNFNKQFFGAFLKKKGFIL